LAYLTALTHLNSGAEDNIRDPNDFNVSAEGARALASLVCLTYLNLSVSQLSDKGLRALRSLTAISRLNLSLVNRHGTDREILGALCSLTAISHLDVSDMHLHDDETFFRSPCPLTSLFGGHVDLQLQSTDLSGEALCEMVMGVSETYWILR
jgi:hypothetical protein